MHVFALFTAAQIFNLPSRRFVIGKAPVTLRSLDFADDPQVTNLRYSRLQVCATSVGNTVNRYRVRTRARDWAHLEASRRRNACKGAVIRSYQPVINRLLSCFSLRHPPQITARLVLTWAKNGKPLPIDRLNSADLGLSGKQIVRDLWQQKDLSEYAGRFKAPVPRHGVVLVRLRPAHTR